MKLIIADREWMVRSSLVQLAAECRPETAVVEAEGGGQLHRALLDNRDADLVLVDETIIAEAEEAMFAHIRKLARGASIGVLMTGESREQVLKAIYYGATVVLLKYQSRDEFRDAFVLALDGKVALPRHILAQDLPAATPRADTIVETVAALLPSETLLTPREREVMALIGNGHSVARIATALKLSPHTIRVHITRIMKKLDLRDRSSLIHYAVSRDRPPRAYEAAGTTASPIAIDPPLRTSR